MTNERTVKGVLGTKLGMTQLWDEHNRLVPVTVIQAGPCVVTQVRPYHGDDGSWNFMESSLPLMSKPAGGLSPRKESSP